MGVEKVDEECIPSNRMKLDDQGPQLAHMCLYYYYIVCTLRVN